MFLEDIKILCEIEDNTKDSILSIYEIQAIEEIKNKIWEFEKEEVQEEFEIKNSKVFIYWINVEVLEVYENTWDDYEEVWELVDNEDYFFENWILNLDLSWNIKVKYNRGYLQDNIPNDIKTSIILLTKNHYDFSNWKIKKETVDWDSVEYDFWKSDIWKTINGLLNKYIDYDFQT